MMDFFPSQSQVSISGAFRQGDIRHCVADLQKARKLIGFELQWRFPDGVRQFLTWATSEEPSPNRYEFSLEEMRQRGPLHG